MPEIPKCDLNRLAELAMPKFDLFSQDAKVNKWLAEHANLTPERPITPPESMDGRRGRRPKVDPMQLDWNKLSGEENVPVVNRTNQKRVCTPCSFTQLTPDWLGSCELLKSSFLCL